MLEAFHVTTALAAAIWTALALWLLHPVAFKLNLLDHPSGRKDHARPTPYLGGIAMGLSVLAIGFATIGLTSPFIGFAIGAGLLIVVGILDDKYDLKWYLRVMVQIMAALSMIYIGGVRVEHLGPVFAMSDTSLGALSVPFTIFATVGLINAINMVDGVDGLAGTLVGVAMVMLLGAALYSGNGPLAQSSAILIGSVFAFLAYNMRFPWQPKAKFFMGNAGSAFLGFAIAWLTFRLTQNAHHPVSPLLALWIIPIPVMDTLVLMIRRLRTRCSPFAGDRNHIHHLMLEGGIGPAQATLILAGFSLVTGLAAGQALRMDIPEPLLLGSFAALCLVWYWLTAQRGRAIRLFRVVFTARGRESEGATATPPDSPLPSTAIQARHASGARLSGMALSKQAWPGMPKSTLRPMATVLHERPHTSSARHREVVEACE